MQSTINQRIKILIDHFGLSARKFSKELGVGETTTQNYLEPGNREPGARYLERLAKRFEIINTRWLLTGEGEPILPNSTPTETNRATLSENKNFSHSQVINTNSGSATQHMLPVTPDQFAALQRENELLRSQLADKERTIQILLNQHPKP